LKGTKGEDVRQQVPIKTAGDTTTASQEGILRTYVVCNGLTNQLLGHAGHISAAIETGKTILIPDVFITNGVQNEQDSEDNGVLKNVLPTEDNSIPLSLIIDMTLLLEKIRSFGGKARIEAYETAIKRYETEPQTCDWLSTLRESNHQTAKEILQTLKPSETFSELIDTNLSSLTPRSALSSVTTLSDGICLHHRDGQDWHNHCLQWEGINDGLWRKNCLNDRNLPLYELVQDRIPLQYPKSWIYYIGDSEPSDQMVQDFKSNIRMDLIHRRKNNLLPDAHVSRTLHLDDISTFTHRDLFAAIDFFTCSKIESFVGNSVSAFSATQIAIRGGMNSSWYNSRSIPLAPMLNVFNIPIVYTYTEESLLAGQHLLKASILSVRDTFGMSTDIHVLYHGTNDHVFQKWLIGQNVIIHHHVPQWLDDIERMRHYGDNSRSHLFQNRGNYIGTWQRIDIPRFINAEYCLYLDSDTIVHSTFGMHFFDPAVTPGLAISQEISETEAIPWNLGVALFNVPHLRESYDGFMRFIHSHAPNPFFDENSISDQGAYISYYKGKIEFLDWIFNIKPYWTNRRHFDNRKIVHYHGLKPQDILKVWMGFPNGYFSPALVMLVIAIRQPKTSKATSLLCRAMYDFSRYISVDEILLGDFCSCNFSDDGEKSVKTCAKFFHELSSVSEDESIEICQKYISEEMEQEMESYYLKSKKEEEDDDDDHEVL
jgi:lipopolysaccharide biosynthesis glycosyltransferase